VHWLVDLNGRNTEHAHKGRRVQIVNASENFAPDSGDAPAVFSKSDSTKIAICDALQNHFLFSSLSRETVLAIVDTMAPAVKYAGEDIVVQGDVGHHFYCLERGSADVFVNGNKVASYSDGGCFGELALMYNDKRAATVRATSECQLWTLEQRTFRRILANTASSSMMARCEFLKRVPMLQQLSNEQINKLAGALSSHSFKRGQYIIHQGAIGDMFYIIQDGTVRCTQIKAQGQEILLLELGPGEYFGEMALMLDEPRHANCIAQTDVQCLALTRAQFVELLGPLQELFASRMRIRILRSVPLLSRLTDEQLDRIAQAMRVQTFTDGEYIIREGQQGTRFYIINEGLVRCTQVDPATGQHKELVQLRPQQFFGERALIKQEPRKANVIAVPFILRALCLRASAARLIV
jgi:cGMP-dependent protein kinase